MNNDDPTQDDFDPDLDVDDSVYHPDQESRLAEDGASPASAPTDIPGPGVRKDDPLTDDDVDSDEVYNEGLAEASGASTTIQDSDTIERVVDEDE